MMMDKTNHLRVDDVRTRYVLVHVENYGTKVFDGSSIIELKANSALTALENMVEDDKGGLFAKVASPTDGHLYDSRFPANGVFFGGTNKAKFPATLDDLRNLPLLNAQGKVSRSVHGDWALTREMANGGYCFESQFYSIPDESSCMSKATYDSVKQGPEQFVLIKTRFPQLIEDTDSSSTLYQNST